ncbi:hypothetical protein FVE85_7193 [Porphyridium purpureum]|uniref:Uncharacterized protein n=1 Tax=Porphyridium purpureum TaxID=35688 RepID=A0A5J4Z8X8_PORPP|nr:hypothetical protein FVE85_7193 [Porphyridium purpureum]|eukprot:POR4795..scf295_1
MRWGRIKCGRMVRSGTQLVPHEEEGCLEVVPFSSEKIAVDAESGCEVVKIQWAPVSPDGLPTNGAEMYWSVDLTRQDDWTFGAHPTAPRDSRILVLAVRKRGTERWKRVHFWNQSPAGSDAAVRDRRDQSQIAHFVLTLNITLDVLDKFHDSKAPRLAPGDSCDSGRDGTARDARAQVSWIEMEEEEDMEKKAAELRTSASELRAKTVTVRESTFQIQAETDDLQEQCETIIEEATSLRAHTAAMQVETESLRERINTIRAHTAAVQTGHGPLSIPQSEIDRLLQGFHFTALPSPTSHIHPEHTSTQSPYDGESITPSGKDVSQQDTAMDTGDYEKEHAHYLAQFDTHVTETRPEADDRMVTHKEELESHVARRMEPGPGVSAHLETFPAKTLTEHDVHSAESRVGVDARMVKMEENSAALQDNTAALRSSGAAMRAKSAAMQIRTEALRAKSTAMAERTAAMREQTQEMQTQRLSMREYTEALEAFTQALQNRRVARQAASVITQSDLQRALQSHLSGAPENLPATAPESGMRAPSATAEVHQPAQHDRVAVLARSVRLEQLMAPEVLLPFVEKLDAMQIANLQTLLPANDDIEHSVRSVPFLQAAVMLSRALRSSPAGVLLPSLGIVQIPDHLQWAPAWYVLLVHLLGIDARLN